MCYIDRKNHINDIKFNIFDINNNSIEFISNENNEFNNNDIDLSNEINKIEDNNSFEHLFMVTSSISIFFYFFFKVINYLS